MINQIGPFEIFAYKRGKQYYRPQPEKVEENIIGGDFECDNLSIPRSDSRYGYVKEKYIRPFSKLFGNGDLLCYTNREMAKKQYNVVCETDSSVDLEGIVQADYQYNFLRVINKLNKTLNSEILNNSSGTSFHLHRNRRWLRENDISAKDMQKATEWMLPLLFAISGRDIKNFAKWCHSVYFRRDNRDAALIKTQQNLWDTAERVDSLHLDDEKYLACNVSKDASIEIRLFSNAHNLDYGMSKLYVEFTDHIIDIASYMKYKRYDQECETLIDMTSEFCNKYARRRKILQNYNLERFFITKHSAALSALDNKWSWLYNKVEELEEYDGSSMDVIRAIRYFSNEYHINVDTIPVNMETVDYVRIRDEMNRLYNESVNRL